MMVPDSPDSVRRAWLAVLALTLVAAAVRFFRLDHEGLWYDELIMARLTGREWSVVFEDIVSGRPPLYLIAGWLWAQVTGTSDAAMRSLSAILGTLVIPLTFVVGRRLLTPAAGVLAAGLMALSPYQVYYSQEHRYYALALLLGTAAIACLLRAWRWNEPAADSSSRQRWGAWAGYILCSSLVFYTHAIAALLLLTIGLLGLWLGALRIIRPRQLVHFLLAQVTILVLIVPWAWLPYQSAMKSHAAGDTEGALPVVWLDAPPWWALIRTAINYVALGQRYVPLWCLALSAVLLTVAAGAVAWRWLARRNKAHTAVPVHDASAEQSPPYPRGSLWVLLAWALLPAGLTLIVSWTVKPLYMDRYFIYSAGGLYLLIAVAVGWVSRQGGRWAAGCTVVALLVVMLGGLGSYYRSPEKGQWHAAADWLMAASSPEDTLLFASERAAHGECENVRDNLAWYAPWAARQTAGVIDVRQTIAEIDAALLAAAAKAPRGGVWLVMWRDPVEATHLQDIWRARPDAPLRLAMEQHFYDLIVLRFDPLR